MTETLRDYGWMLPAEEGYIIITDYREAEEIFRNPKVFRSSGGRGMESEEFIHDILVDLDGEDHFSRRRTLAKVMSQGHIEHYAEVLRAATIKYLDGYRSMTSTRNADGLVRFDLVEFSRNVFWHLGASMTGIDGIETPEAIAALQTAVTPAHEGMTILFSQKDHSMVTHDAREAIVRFEREFYAHSASRRRALLDRVARGDVDPEILPVDVLTLLLEDSAGLPAELIVRECIGFLGASVGNTVNVTCHAIAELSAWTRDHPDARARLHDDSFIAALVDETIRLHRTGNPFLIRDTLTDTVLASERSISAGAHVAIDLRSISRDRNVFGEDADSFRPEREITGPRVKGYGMGFSTGPHVCIAKRMVVNDTGTSSPRIIDLVLRELLAAGVRPDAERRSVRELHGGDRFGKFPVVMPAT